MKVIKTDINGVTLSEQTIKQTNLGNGVAVIDVFDLFTKLSK